LKRYLFAALAALIFCAPAQARTDAWPLHHGTTAARSSRGPRVAELQYLLRNPRPRQNVWGKVKGTLQPGTFTDGIYDLATARAVIAWKYRVGFPSRGQCGSKVDEWRQTKVTPWFIHLVTSGSGRPYCWVAVAAKRIAKAERGATPLALKLASFELGQVGTWGSYRYATYFGLPTWWQWCAIFQNYSRVHVNLGRFPSPDPWSVPYLIGMGQAHVNGDWLSAVAKVGEWVLYYGDISHIGYVIKVDQNGYYWTVEGNYGNHVAEVHHSPYDHLHYFLVDPQVVR
jgi:hypothetical protein